MAKKVNIVEITVKDGETYRVGNRVGVAGDALVNTAVERIVYEQHGYNKGKQGNLPSYIIFFEESNIRKVISQDRIVEFAAELVEVEEAPAEIAPELPES